MEPTTSPWVDPRFLLPALSAFVFLVAWFVRLEYKASATEARQKEFEGSITEYVDEIKSEHREVKKAFYSHAADTKVHHNEEMFKEFRQGLERRFTSIDEKLQDISRKLDAANGIHRTQG